MANRVEKAVQHDPQVSEIVPARRLDYASPCLQVYGNIRDLTAGGSAGIHEGVRGGNMSRLKP